MTSDGHADMPAVPWHKPRRTDPRQPLTRDAIVEVGIRILDAEGMAGVTMRRVAQELGTGPASLYAHVSNKDELLELMLEEISGEITLPDHPEPDRWKEQILQLCLDAQHVYTRHRDITVVSLGSMPVGPNKLLPAEFMLDLMIRAGIPGQVAAWALDGLGQLIDVDAYEAFVYGMKAGSGIDLEAYFDEVGQYFRRLPKDRFPRISAMAETMTTGDGDDRFRFKVEVFLRGLESYIEH
ncbi:transcriptional regulator [Kitasatospora sp. NE20-6]|uniref:TetR/AcrR family transcriptional regulator n=1 Tax=Kitasatospora sp. NE20-6 TaxID=2859066 RepID=UPI0034DC3E12